MARTQAPSSRERIEEQAANWLVRRDADRFGVADEQQLENWLSESASHAVAYYRLAAAWSAANRLKVLGAGKVRHAAPSRGNVGLHSYLAAAASVLLTAAASMLLTLGLYELLSDAFHGYRYSTPIGGIATVPMADGSGVTLNTDSAVRIAITRTGRRVELDRGEAFFDVAKDPRRPFIVIADDKRITAVGTQFAVRRDGAITRVIVTEGRVRIDTAAGAPTQLSAGAIAEARTGRVLVQDRPTVKTE